MAKEQGLAGGKVAMNSLHRERQKWTPNVSNSVASNMPRQYGSINIKIST